MPTQTPASASAQSPQATVRSRMMIVVLLLSLLYSAVVLVREWKYTEKANPLMHQSSTMRALLFQKGARLDLYDPHELFVRSGQEPNLGTERFRAPRLLSTRAVLIGNGTSARVRDLGSAYTYDPLTAAQNSEILSLGRNTNFTYYIPEGPDHTHLRIDFARCGQIADIPLPTAELWYDARTLFDTLALPMQQKMVLSPAETSLALVHHDAFPRITLVQLIERQAVALSVPSFNPDQLHFSPFFMDDQTLLFSVLDRDHWGTVRYRLSTGTYEILSENFTDHTYHSVAGDIMLQQSFFDETINVP
ncbi:MAG: hypothetical protein Q7S29_05195, partial [Candidatus Peribacter sp.]|nr:hypothetical protein [Candidatus Peribacter sp.]